MSGLLTTIALHLAGGWLGAQAAAFVSGGRRLGFWARSFAGLLGGTVVGQAVERLPVLDSMFSWLDRWFGSGHVEDIIAGVTGGLVFGVVFGFFGRRE